MAIKIEEPFEGRQCNVCHRKADVKEILFRSECNNSGISVALCFKCRKQLVNVIMSHDLITDEETA